MIIGSTLGLRSIEEEDLPGLRDWRNISEFRRHFREHRELNMLNQKSWLRSISDSKNDFMFAMVDLANQELIGACGLLYTNWIIRSADFSFYIGKNGAYIDDDGLAKEAASLLIQYGFQTLNLNKIWMELYEFDHKKLAFFESFGFQVDGRLRANAFDNGQYWDSYIVSLLRADWLGADER